MSEIMTKPYGRIYKNKSNVSITPFDIYNLYPVGSIYISVNSTNPSNYFGGTWERISQGRFLIGVGAPVANNETCFGDLNNSGYVFNANSMGGQYAHTLTVNEMPVHSHGMDDSGWHSHEQNVTANGSVKTGHLRRSIQGQVNGLTGIVHTSNLKYAPWVEKGTRPHTIRPKRKKFLYWRGASHPVKKVHHPGGRAKPYLIPAFEQEKPKFLQNLKDCIKW